MNINYPIIAVFAVCLILLIIFLIWRNLKDKRKFEREMNDAEIKPEKHEEDLLH